MRRARDVVVIGASAGGIQALRTILAGITPSFPGLMLVAQHRSPYHTDHLAEVIRGRTQHIVIEPSDNERLEMGRVYIAPRDLHLVVEDGRVRALRGPKENFTRPAVDPLFRSAAAAYGPRVVGVLLSGGGQDGVRGLIAIKAAGGLSLVQKPSEAVAKSMPETALAEDDV